MLSLGIVSQEEFDMVYMLSYIAWPTEQVDQGVRIQEIGGRRTWSAGTEFAAAHFTGGKASFDGSFTIPLRFIKECASRANLESEVELFITEAGGKFYSTNDLFLASNFKLHDKIKSLL